MSEKKEVVVFVSGCFDIVHGGHIEFFEEARSLGTKLVLHIAGDESLWKHKNRNPSLPIDHKIRLLSQLSIVDEVQYTTDEDLLKHNTTLGLDFEKNFLRTKPDILAVTSDDRYESVKRELCEKIGCKYVKLGKTISSHLESFTSTSEIVSKIRAPSWAPIRVDFGGGWLDVPKFQCPDGYIVNCSVIPGVSIRDLNGYKKGSGVGGSGAYAVLCGKNGIKEELEMGVGWQDPAIVYETGLCVWKSGDWPILVIKRNPCIEGNLNLMGKLALLWSGKDYSTPVLVGKSRDLTLVKQAGLMGKEAVEENSFEKLCECIKISYQMQLKEGLKPLPDFGTEICKKYCGSGGYSCYVFESTEKRNSFVENMNKKEGEEARIIEPYIRMNRPVKEEEEIIRFGYPWNRE